MYKRLYSILHYIIFLGGGIFLVWWQLRGMSPDDEKEFYNALNHANYWLVIPIVIMALLSHLSRAIRWNLLMEPLDYKPALKNVFAVTMVGYLANSAVPRLGEILKCTFLARYENLKVDKLVGTILIERTFDFVCFLIFIAITILVQLDLLGNFINEKITKMFNNPGMPFWLKFIIFAAGIVILVLFLKMLFRKFPGNRIISKINTVFNGIVMGFKSIRNLRKRKLFLFYTLMIWLLYLLQIYIGFYSMEGTAALGIKAACSVLTLATLAMIVTPGGIGSFPLFVMEILLIYNISSPVGKAFGWLIWGVSTGIIVIFGLLSLLLLPYINRKKNEISQQYTQQNI